MFQPLADRPVTLFLPSGPRHDDDDPPPLLADFEGDLGVPACYHCEDCQQNVFPDGYPVLPLGGPADEPDSDAATRSPEIGGTPTP
jgi:hypothetical protein